MTFFGPGKMPDYHQSPGEIRPWERPVMPEKPEGLGSIISKSLGKGLGEGVGSSLNQALTKKQIDRALGGLSPNATAKEVFDVASQLPPEAQQLFVKTYMPQREMEMEQQQKQQALQARQEGSSVLDSYLLNAIAKKEGIQPDALQPENIGNLQPKDVANQFEKAQKLKRLAESLPNATFEQKKFILEQLQKAEDEEKKETVEEGKLAYQENKDYLKQIKNLGSDYVTQKSDIQRMRKLEEKGDINTAWRAKASDFFGVRDILSADTQELEKLSMNQQRRLKDIYGSRPTNIDIQNFNKTIPSLYQDPEGRKRIYDYMEFVNDAGKVKYDAYKEIMKGRKYPPLDVQEQVDAMSAPKLEELANRFNKDTNYDYASPDALEQRDSEKAAETKQAAATAAPTVPQELKAPEQQKQESMGMLSALRERGRYSKRFETAKPNETAQSIAKNAIRTAARAGEIVLGGPGDLAKFASELNAKDYKGLSEVQNAGQWLKKVLPSSTAIREFNNKITGGYTEPSSDLQRKADEYVSSVASFFSPLDAMGKAKVGAKLVKTAGWALAGQLGKETAAQVTKDKATQEYARIGTQLLASMISPSKAKNFINSMYTESESFKPSTASIPNNNVINHIQKAESILTKGMDRPGTAEALARLEKFKKTASQGLIPVEDLINDKKSLNKWYYKHSPSERKELDHVKKAIHDSLSEYGKENPSWYNKYRAADSAHEIFEKSKKISNFIEGKAKKFGMHGAVSTGTLETAMTIGGHGAILPKFALTAPLGFGILKSGEALYRGFNNPSFGHLYLQTLVSAIKEDGQALARNLSRLEKTSAQIEKEKKEKTKK